MVGQLRFVGLTGGIGSGKSLVADMIRAFGIPVLDADQLARAVVAPGEPAHADIAAAWPDVVAPDGHIDRKKLAARVFADPDARKRLESITHPRIHARALAGARSLEERGHRLAFYEAALLVEAGRQKDFDGLVLVEATLDQQLARVMARDHVSRDAVLARMAAQLPVADKRRTATHVIDNSGDAAATRRQVEHLLAALKTGPTSA